MSSFADSDKIGHYVRSCDPYLEAIPAGCWGWVRPLGPGWPWGLATAQLPVQCLESSEHRWEPDPAWFGAAGHSLWDRPGSEQPLSTSLCGTWWMFSNKYQPPIFSGPRPWLRPVVSFCQSSLILGSREYSAEQHVIAFQMSAPTHPKSSSFLSQNILTLSCMGYLDSFSSNSAGFHRASWWGDAHTFPTEASNNSAHCFI